MKVLIDSNVVLDILFKNDSFYTQIIGRAARNAAGKVIMYAGRMSDAMKKAIAKTRRRP